MRALPDLLTTKPSAIELLDAKLMQLAKNSLKHNLKISDEVPAAMLIVEYRNESQTDSSRNINIQM